MCELASSTVVTTSLDGRLHILEWNIMSNLIEMTPQMVCGSTWAISKALESSSRSLQVKKVARRLTTTKVKSMAKIETQPYS